MFHPSEPSPKSELTGALRLIVFIGVGTALAFLSWFIYEKATDITMFHSATHALRPLEFHLWPTADSIYSSLTSFAWTGHEGQMLLLAAGIPHALLAGVFFCDLFMMTLPASMQFLDPLPFVYSFVEILENSLYLAILFANPTRLFIAHLVGYVTIAKWVLVAIIAVLSFFGLISLPCQWSFAATHHHHEAMKAHKPKAA